MIVMDELRGQSYELRGQFCPIPDQRSASWQGDYGKLRYRETVCVPTPPEECARVDALIDAANGDFHRRGESLMSSEQSASASPREIVWDIAANQVRVDGEPVPYNMQLTTVLNADGRLIAAIAVATDAPEPTRS